MVLKEWDPVKNLFTSRTQLVEITYIQQNKSNPCAISHLALADDYAVLSIRKVPEEGHPVSPVYDHNPWEEATN